MDDFLKKTAAILSFLVLILWTATFLPASRKGYRAARIRFFLGVFLAGLILVYLAPSTVYEGPFPRYGQEKIAFFACNYQISQSAQFCPDHDFKCFCSNINALATMASCYYRAHTKEIYGFLKMCNSECNITLSKKEFDDSYSYYIKYAEPGKQRKLNETFIDNHPVMLNESDLDVYKRSFEGYMGNYDQSASCGVVLLGYWVFVMTMASLGNWTKVFFPSLMMWFNGIWSNRFRKFISLPATIGKRKAGEKQLLKILDMLVPSRAETSIISVFFVLCLFLTKCAIYKIEEDPIFKSPTKAMMKAVAVRTGVVATEMTPLLMLFGGRNNFLQWLTRWEYSVFITFHRWIARILLFFATAHGICYFPTTLVYIHERFVIWGVVCFGACGVLLVQSLLVLRRRWYEAFLIIHILLAALFVAGAWVHVNERRFVFYFYTSFAIWIFDRIIRVMSIISFGFPKAKIVLCGDVLKIFIPINNHCKLVPGGHMFIHFLKPSYFWQSHPFTYTIESKEKKQIVLFVKVKDGITKRLYDTLRNDPEGIVSMKVAVEGSYGLLTPAAKYDNSVFLAGGYGIPGIYSEAKELESKSNKYDKKIKLIWITSEYNSLLWFYEELLALRETHISVTIYITRPQKPVCFSNFPTCITKTETFAKVHECLETENLRESEIVEFLRKGLPHIEFREERPLIGFLVSEQIELSLKSVAFITCGNPQMVDDVRASIVKNLKYEEKKRIDYFEQLQVWA